MNKPLNHDSIAKAMKEAAWVAKHGAREERAGRFIAGQGSASAGTQEKAKKRTR